jgi:hypothetical protein
LLPQIVHWGKAPAAIAADELRLDFGHLAVVGTIDHPEFMNHHDGRSLLRGFNIPKAARLDSIFQGMKQRLLSNPELVR